MLDMKWIRQNGAQVQAAADRKGIRLQVEELLEWDRRKRQLLQRTEEGRQARNRLSQEIGLLVQAGKKPEAEQAKREVREWNSSLDLLEKELQQAEEKNTRAYAAGSQHRVAGYARRAFGCGQYRGSEIRCTA